MTDYYSILGISKTANEIEIKAAFRRLAKIYHPDKNPNNPNANHLFQNILKAYNTLIHPSSRRRYDMRGTEVFSQSGKTQHAKRKTQKEWIFTEEELQRRQYYEKHYKAKQQERNSQPASPQKSHSDYKYILFATPIAVALLMLIISMFTDTPPTAPITVKNKNFAKAIELPQVSTEKNLNLQPVNGGKPYTGYFGSVKTFITTNSLEIKNLSNYDAVIVLFDKKTNAYLQHCFIESSFSIEFSKLTEGVYWKCMLGKNWDKQKLLNNKDVRGGFDSIVQYQNRKLNTVTFGNKKPRLQINELGVLKSGLKNQKMISTEAEFFER